MSLCCSLFQSLCNQQGNIQFFETTSIQEADVLGFSFLKRSKSLKMVGRRTGTPPTKVDKAEGSSSCVYNKPASSNARVTPIGHSRRFHVPSETSSLSVETSSSCERTNWRKLWFISRGAGSRTTSPFSSKCVISACTTNRKPVLASWNNAAFSYLVH